MFLQIGCCCSCEPRLVCAHVWCRCCYCCTIHLVSIMSTLTLTHHLSVCLSSPSYRFVLWSFVDDPWRSSLRRSLSFVWRNSLCVYWCLFVTHSRRSFSFALSLSFRFDLLFVIIIVYFQSLSIRLNINCQVGLPYVSKSSGLIFSTEERGFSMTTLLWKIFKGRHC